MLRLITDPFITFALKEVANFANNSTDMLRETANKGGGGPKSRKLCRRHLSMAPNVCHKISLGFSTKMNGPLILAQLINQLVILIQNVVISSNDGKNANVISLSELSCLYYMRN